jgi:branched-chain amino acid transport system substrate-binding protein
MTPRSPAPPPRAWPILSVIALACAPAPEPEPAPVLRLGVLAVLGDVTWETSGQPTVQGATLAAEELNDGGGVEVGGVAHQVELVIREFEDRPDAATTSARALLNQQDVHAIIGPQFSRHAIAVSNLAEAARVPMISPMSSSPLTTRGKEWIYRIAFADDFQAEVMARFAGEELGARRAAMLYDVSSDYSRELAALFATQFVGNGGAIVADETFTGDRADDFSDQLGRIAAASPDVVYLPNETPNATAQIVQARALGLDAVLLGSDTWDVSRVAAAPQAEGSFVLDLWVPDLETVAARGFGDRFREAFGVEPKTSAATTYDAVFLIAQALSGQESVSPSNIRAGLASIRSFEGVTGLIRYAGSGDPVRSAVMLRLENGVPIVHKVLAPPDS